MTRALTPAEMEWACREYDRDPTPSHMREVKFMIATAMTFDADLTKIEGNIPEIDDYHERKHNMGRMETKEDLKRQQRVARAVERAWECELLDLDIQFGQRVWLVQQQSPVDYTVRKDGERTAGVEVRSRFITVGRYSTIKIGQKKIRKMRAWGRKKEVPVFLVVHFAEDDKMRWIDICKAKKYSSDVDRGEMVKVLRGTDKEKAWCFPIEEWKPLNKELDS